MIKEKLMQGDIEPVIYCLEDSISTLLLYMYLETHRDDFRKEGFLEIPVARDDELDVTVEERGQKGDGIARVDGFIIIIPGARVGKSYRIKIKETTPKFAFGEIVDDLEES